MKFPKLRHLEVTYIFYACNDRISRIILGAQDARVSRSQKGKGVIQKQMKLGYDGLGGGQ